MSLAEDRAELPQPNHGYTIRERLGEGAWKVAYRASSMNSLADKALLYYHDDVTPREIIRDVTALMKAHLDHRFSDYLADVDGYFYDKAGKIFIVEELLSRPLDKVGRIRDHFTFLRIARDLCRGLVAIHDSDLVHRDLKLDNCGLDHSGRAKIFDLGSVTSEPGSLRGSILTRAPELLAIDARGEVSFQPSADIWAMGATLFALRIGVFPFVTQEEASHRKLLNDQFRLHKIDKTERDEEKAKIDTRIAERGRYPDAERALISRLENEFRGPTLDTMKSMLNFIPSQRPNAREVESAWSELASDEISGAAKSANYDSQDNSNLIQFLEAVKDREIEITTKMLDTIIDDYEKGRLNLSSEEKVVVDRLFQELND